jgi:hypothetical protein
MFRHWLIACANQLHLEGMHNRTCNLILNRKDLLHFAIERLGPQMIAVSHINQLSGYAQPVTSFAHTAFQYCPHVQLLADPADVFVFSFERKARSSSGHAKAFQS